MVLYASTMGSQFNTTDYEIAANRNSPDTNSASHDLSLMAIDNITGSQPHNKQCSNNSAQ